MKNILGFLFISFGVMVALKEEYHCKNYSEIFSKMTNSRSSSESTPSVEDQVVYISGLGDFDQSDLETTSKAITEVYGLKCEIISPISTSDILYNKKGKLDAEVCNRQLNPLNKTVYVTNEYVMSGGIIVCGASTNSGNFVIVSDNFNNNVRTTVLHEMAHTFGLGHCDNQCILGHIKLGEPNGKFCNDCKTKLKLK